MGTLNKTSSRFSPTDLIRARRPELFSDTVFAYAAVLDSGQLAFHLETLTQRKEEIGFGHFCRCLAENELCPNLLPQTGPTGRGNSKVDPRRFQWPTPSPALPQERPPLPTRDRRRMGFPLL
jgi:hypothetical protein